jgi:8-oxo-dGTP pyrophosphatase MutT (NUDIX family)
MNTGEHGNERQEFSAGVVLFREEQGKRKYLVLHYPGGHFDFPKGHLEAGENEMQAAVRELSEETGVTAGNFYDGFSEKITYDFRRRDIRIHKTVTFFLASTGSSKITISHEHRGYLWLDYTAALAKITFENARNLLQKAEQFLLNGNQPNHESQL